VAEERSLTEGGDERPDSDERSRIRQLQAGSDDAFDWLIAEYGPPIFRLAYRILNDRADAADAVQDVFLKVFRNIGQFHGESSLKTWIYRIAVNTVSNQNRWWRRHKEQETSLEEQESWKRNGCLGHCDNSQNPFETVLSHETQNMVRKALARLPESSRTVLILREMESLSYDEIADIMHLSLGTVKSRLARARDALKCEVESMIGSDAATVPVWNTAAE